ncbi:XopA/Hpa1 family type III secretion system protein [Xanthomonas hortorum]|uniref:XopA/Hpa1 family type III secretion system protein n=1 Tax=Xanthomonas hortorum TaxID=56454 RepID=UPI0021140CE6|nr:XopA/Hpa1 family type III secretion system protein [Xanthomonas hortorum]UUE96938.1 hypothetical protein NDY24_13390 [Xanthomonas hortorum pv. pelargonii]UUF01020.1 hypothetical protein NDY25_13585 [Xanthomonas hortorum pv. pelargonii]
MDSIGNNFSNIGNLQTMGIGPQQHEDSSQQSPSAGSEQQLDQLLAMFIMMMLQQSQGSDANQECGNEQPQNGQQEGLSPLTQMLMQIVMQLMQNQGGAGMGGGRFGQQQPGRQRLIGNACRLPRHAAACTFSQHRLHPEALFRVRRYAGSARTTAAAASHSFGDA